MEIYTIKDAALYLGVSERMVKYYLARKQLAPARRFRQILVFRREDLDHFRARIRDKGGRPAQAVG